MNKPQTSQKNAFDKKVCIFSHDYLKCCRYITRIEDPRNEFTKKLYSKLISSSMLLEDFLDFHGAKNNKDWYYYRELAAAVRHLSLGANFQKHLSNRLVFYDLSNYSDFQKDGEVTLDFLTKTLADMAPVILKEAQRHDIPVPEDQFSKDDFPSITTDDLLRYNIDDQDKDLQKKHIVKIASEFLNITKDFDQLKFYVPYPHEDILLLVPDKINEVEIRRYEMLLHSLQSSFDTYVIHGGFRYGNRKLKQLRGAFSVVFHLLQMVGRLLHFYERHLYEAGYKNTYKIIQDKLASLINPAILLDRTINYGLFYACHFLTNGQELAGEILNENIERAKIKVNIPQKLGFHARPSLLVAKIVQHYGGQVELCLGEDRFDASSVLDIQWAGGKIQKENLQEVVFEGDARTLKDIEILAGVNYGEDTMGKGVPLPSELKYLM
ncbi:MAG: HPr family phosphocarrier protein [Deltaproteobacteria bacterium]|jgi:phosphotransferase system HPr-like phosphotransfer protein|nr:HPr family phosphocarrier protein [Deltaproteobacteria bacterium]